MDTYLYNGKERRKRVQDYIFESELPSLKKMWDAQDEALKHKKEEFLFLQYPCYIVVCDESVDYFEVAKINPQTGEIKYNLEYGEVSKEGIIRIEKHATIYKTQRPLEGER